MNMQLKLNYRDRQSLGFPIARRPKPVSDLDVAIVGLSRMSMILIAVVALIYALGAWSSFLIPLSSAIVIGMMLSPLVDRIEAVGVPSLLAIPIMLGVLGGLLYGSAILLMTPLTEGLRSVPDIASEIGRRLSALRAPLDLLGQVEDALSRVKSGKPNVERVSVDNNDLLTGILAIAPPAIGQIVLFTGALVFFLYGRVSMRISLLRMCMSRPARLRVARILRDTEANISRYLLTIFFINCGLGLTVCFAMWLIGMPNPVMWGVIAAVLNFLPYIGSMLTAALIGGAGLLSFESLSLGLAPLAMFLALTTLEGQFITPGILGRSLTLNPFLVFVSIAFWLWLWGPVGAFMAVPLLIIISVTIVHIVPARAK